MVDSSRVGIASSARLIQTPARRSILWLISATTRPEIVMPTVQALTAVPITAGMTP